MIFLFLVDLARGSLRSSGRPDWIAITYVCRYWRSAALGQPKLWSSITPGLSISWFQAMVERSAPLLMSIDIRIRPCFEDGLGSLAASKLLLTSRIRTLCLSGYRADILSILDRLCGPSPLEALDLWVMFSTVHPLAVDLPVALFGGKAPQFRHLKFETITRIRAPGWLLAGVTHFTTCERISLHELLGALQAMPQLEVLRIMKVFNIWYETDLPSMCRRGAPRCHASRSSPSAALSRTS